MKYFIALSAVILAASAMPTELGKEAAVLNSTRNAWSAQTGFASMHGGTRGGAGGAVWTVWDAWALRDAILTDNARIVSVRGRIDLTPLFTASPGVILRIGSWKTVVGGDRNAMIFGGGFKCFESSNIIFENIKIHNALSYAPGERPNGNGGILGQVAGAWSQVDAIDLEVCTHVWVTHCNFADDPWVAASVPDNQRRHDGLIDIKRRSNFITISNNIFENHNLVSLVGHDDSNGWEDTGFLKVTFVLNWYRGTTQRNPMVRFGEVHVLNNLYTDISSYGIGVWTGARIYAERNHFINTRRAWGWSSSPIPNPQGTLFNFNNIMTNSGNDAGIGSGVNWVPSQYYGYTPMANSNVESHVRTFAGVI